MFLFNFLLFVSLKRSRQILVVKMLIFFVVKFSGRNLKYRSETVIYNLITVIFGLVCLEVLCLKLQLDELYQFSWLGLGLVCGVSLINNTRTNKWPELAAPFLHIGIPKRFAFIFFIKSFVVSLKTLASPLEPERVFLWISRRDTTLLKLADVYVQILFLFFVESKQMWLHSIGYFRLMHLGRRW